MKKNWMQSYIVTIPVGLVILAVLEMANIVRKAWK